MCPNIEPVVDRRTLTPAISSMWAWGNPVPAKDDPRGLGQAGHGACRARRIRGLTPTHECEPSVPFAADQGAAISQWLSERRDRVARRRTAGVCARRRRGMGRESESGHPVDDRSPQRRPVRRVQLDVEPWTENPNWTSDPAAIGQYILLVRQAQASAHGLGMSWVLDPQTEH